MQVKFFFCYYLCYSVTVSLKITCYFCYFVTVSFLKKTVTFVTLLLCL